MLAQTAPDTQLRSGPTWTPSRKLLTWLAGAVVAIVALIPPLYVVSRAAEESRNVAYWDEIETALPLMMRLQGGVTPGSFLTELFALCNEHRMVTSRLIYACSFWLTGTINFSVIGLIGNLTIIALCVLLIVQAGNALRRLQLGVCLSFLMFSLAHYENFLWSGASIDHFQIVLLAGAAIVALTRSTHVGVVIGGLFALLATFTLAHGLMLWFVGAGMLLLERRWRDLLIWAVLTAIGIGGFLLGFEVNASHQFAGTSFDAFMDIAGYWLTLVGAVPAIGNTCVAPWFGLALLGTMGWLASHGYAQREKTAFALACFAIAALALIAFGRAAQSGGTIHSRYMVLSALAWGLTTFVLLQWFTERGQALRSLACAAPVLAAINLTANHTYEHDANSWVECRDRAALRFNQHGVDGRGAFSLFPIPDFSTRVLNEAEQRGVYRMGSICSPRSFPHAQPSSRIIYFVDEMTVTSRSAYVEGWAAIPGRRSERGEVHLVLRSGTQMHVFTTVTSARPDVTKETKNPEWELSGYRFGRRRDRLPTGEFQIGFLIADEDGKNAEYIMTDHKMILIGDGKAVLAGAAD